MTGFESSDDVPAFSTSVTPVEGPREGLLEGPWSCGFLVRAAMPLRSKSNFRRSRRQSGAGDAWERSRAFEESLGWLLRSARPSGWVVGEREVPLAARPVVVAAIAARSRLDVANFSKSVLDAAEGVLYVTDASVLGVLCLGERGEGGGTVLGFAQLAPGSAPAAVAASLAVLGERLAVSLADERREH